MLARRTAVVAAMGLSALVLGGAAVVEDKLEPLPLKYPRPGMAPTPKEVQGIRPDQLEKPALRPRDPVMAPAGCVNLALKRPVTSSDPEPMIGKLEQITDGDKEAMDSARVELASGKQWVQIDLGKSAELHAILFWHRPENFIVVKGVVVQVANDADFIEGVQTLFNNDQDNSVGLGLGGDKYYFEGHQGKLVLAKGVKARYVRLWSRGNTTSDSNDYIEVEVWGR